MQDIRNVYLSTYWGKAAITNYRRRQRIVLKLQTISLLLDQLDLNIPAALHLRKSCSCPPLPHVDPRSEYHFTRKFIDSLKEDELESVRAAPDEDAVTAIMQEIMDKRVVEKVRFGSDLKGYLN